MLRLLAGTERVRRLRPSAPVDFPACPDRQPRRSNGMLPELFSNPSSFGSGGVVFLRLRMEGE
jgi:hypothetical protein